MTSNEALKPCPFCGGEAVLCESHRNHWYVACSRCGVCRSTFANGGVEQDQARAIRSWNTRSTDTPVCASTEDDLSRAVVRRLRENEAARCPSDELPKHYEGGTKPEASQAPDTIERLREALDYLLQAVEIVNSGEHVYVDPHAIADARDALSSIPEPVKSHEQ